MKHLLYIVFFITYLIIPSAQASEASLTMGVSPDYPPFEFKKNDKIEGFDIEAAKLIAKELGFKLNIVEMDFNNIIPALNSNKINFAISSLSATPDRVNNIDFSINYYTTSFSIISLKDSKINNLSEAKGKILGAQLGSTMAEFAKSSDSKNVFELSSNIQLIEEVLLKRIDGVVLETAQAENFVKNNENLTYINVPSNQEGYAVAFKKNSPLLKDFNRAIEKLKNNKELDKLKDFWLNYQDEETLEKNLWLDSLLLVPEGLYITLKYAFISVFCGLILGTLLALAKLSNSSITKLLASFYTSIFRGTPLLVQLSLIYFGLPSLFPIKITAFSAGILAFSLNSAAYISEIIRAGVLAIDKGQFEASKSLGIPYYLMMKDIIFPQAFRNMLPSIVNEVINMVKESAIISTIGELDLMRRAQIVAAQNYSYFEPILIAALCYYIVVTILTFVANILEKRLKIND